VGVSAGFLILWTINAQTGALAPLASLQPSGLSTAHNIGDIGYDAADNRYYGEDVIGLARHVRSDFGKNLSTIERNSDWSRPAEGKKYAVGRPDFSPNP
jgi:hypothetical protein